MLQPQPPSEPNQLNDIFLIQKRKISEMKTLHESNQKKDSLQTQNSKYLIIKDKDKAKEYSNRLKNESNQSEKLNKENFDGEVSPFNIKELNVNISDLNCWEYSMFDYEIVLSEEIPFVNSGFLPLIELERKESKERKERKEIEMRNILINLGLEFKLNFTLKGESSLWIFTRSDSNIEFDKYTTVIKLSKEDKSQKCFLTLGTFVYDQRGNKTLKTFLRRQLINYNKAKGKEFYEKDYCDFKMTILDAGEERIQVKVLFNDSNIENDIHGDFFLPMFDYSKVMISGSGQSCLLKEFSIKGFHKIALQIQGEGRNCECCLVW